MRGSIFASLFNVLIIIFIFKAVAKAIKKSKSQNSADKEQPSNKPSGSQSFDRPVAQVKKIRFDTKPAAEANRALKRCPQCGGEIPLYMMKCDICGTKQPGCGASFLVFIIIIVLLIGFVFAQGNGILLTDYFRQFIGWLNGLQ